MRNKETIESLAAVVVDLMTTQIGLATLEGEVDFNLLMSIRQDIANALKKIAHMQIDHFWPDEVFQMASLCSRYSN